MRVSIDRAGRLVIPKELREQVGLTAGEVDIVVQGAGLLIEVEARGHLREQEGRLVVEAGGAPGPEVTEELVRELRLGLQR